LPLLALPRESKREKEEGREIEQGRGKKTDKKKDKEKEKRRKRHLKMRPDLLYFPLHCQERETETGRGKVVNRAAEYWEPI